MNQPRGYTNDNILLDSAESVTPIVAGELVKLDSNGDALRVTEGDACVGMAIKDEYSPRTGVTPKVAVFTGYGDNPTVLLDIATGSTIGDIGDPVYAKTSKTIQGSADATTNDKAVGTLIGLKSSTVAIVRLWSALNNAPIDKA